MVPVLVSVCSYLGLAFILAGAFARQPWVAAAGVGLATSGAWWPWRLRRGAGGAPLDALLPEFQFNERHARRVHAVPRAVYEATRMVTAREIRLFRILTWIRSPRLPGRLGRESILQPVPDDPILDAAARSGFVWLADAPPHEMVLGTRLIGGAMHAPEAGTFRDLRGPGVKAAMDFRIGEDGGAVRLTTETRIVAHDGRARRAFGLYWAFIYPGSSLIRYTWLAAVARRAEAGGPSGP